MTLRAIIGYHLEQAYEQRFGLGPVGPGAVALRTRGRTKLWSAGQRALLRGDLAAGVNLFERAMRLGDQDDDDRADIVIRLASVLVQLGQLEEAEAMLEQGLRPSGTFPRRGERNPRRDRP
ncbi:MAG: tetratricopeptide repeat protein [Gaiellaceae bacterium]